MFDESKGTVVINRLRRLADFHDASAAADAPDLIWDDLAAGRLVIVDLAVGSQEVSKILSERLVFRLLDKASQRFRDNKDNIPIQIMVEEAHNLFDREKMREIAGQRRPLGPPVEGGREISTWG